jgi:GTP-binding protein EngB required for normal cell division
MTLPTVQYFRSIKIEYTIQVYTSNDMNSILIIKLLPVLRHHSKRSVCFTAIENHRLISTSIHDTNQLEILPFRRQEQRRSMATKRRQQRQRQQQQQGGGGGGTSYTSAWGSNGGAGGGPSPRSTKRRTKNNNNNNKYNKQWQQERVGIRAPKNYMKKLPKPKEQFSIPPALLSSTASPYVYISQTVLGGDGGGDGNSEGDDDTSQTIIDPSTLFAEVTHSYSNDDDDDDKSYYGNKYLPPLFSKGDFEYFSPRSELMNYRYPVQGMPEVAFLGRSNVGKSSLINAIMRKNLCITSKSPGRTQLPYYYGLISKADPERQLLQQTKGKTSIKKGDPSGQPQGFIVDLPGYGFAKKPMSITEDWQKDTQDLLLHRRHDAKVLKRLFLLMDARRGVQGPNEHDRIVMRWLEDAEIPFTVVLTKADRVSVPVVVRQVNDFCLRFASQQHHQQDQDQDQDDEYDFGVAQSPIIHVTSSARGWGINELMLSIETEFCGENYDDDEDINDVDVLL